jgi:hypothetical protein
MLAIIHQTEWKYGKEKKKRIVEYTSGLYGQMESPSHRPPSRCTLFVPKGTPDPNPDQTPIAPTPNKKRKEERKEKRKDKTAEATQIEPISQAWFVAWRGQSDIVHKMKMRTALLALEQNSPHLIYACRAPTTLRHLGDEGRGVVVVAAAAADPRALVPSHTLPGMGMARTVASAGPALPPAECTG